MDNLHNIDNTFTLGQHAPSVAELCDGDRAAHFDGAYKRQATLPDTEYADLIALFEKHADWHDGIAYIRVETAADLVVDREGA